MMPISNCYLSGGRHRAWAWYFGGNECPISRLVEDWIKLVVVIGGKFASSKLYWLVEHRRADWYSYLIGELE